MKRTSLTRTIVVLGGTLILAGCQTFSPDGGMSLTSTFADEKLGKDTVAIRSADDASAAHARVQKLIKRTLTADTAVQIALLNNRGLQAAYNELGIAETAMVAESLPPNPKLSISRLSGADLEIERRIVADILELATLPARAEIAQDRFRQAQLRAAGETVTGRRRNPAGILQRGGKSTTRNTAWRRANRRRQRRQARHPPRPKRRAQ